MEKVPICLPWRDAWTDMQHDLLRSFPWPDLRSNFEVELSGSRDDQNRACRICVDASWWDRLCYTIPTSRVVLDSYFSGWLDSDSLTIQVTQLWLNSTFHFSWLTQLRLNSNAKFPTLTQLRLNSFESELSQIWLTTHHILPNLTKMCWPGGGSTVVGSCRSVLSLWRYRQKGKILTFFLRKNQWLNFDSSCIQLTQFWLKWRSAVYNNWEWFDSDSTHDLNFHGRLDSDSTHLSQSGVKFDSRLMSRAQPCLRLKFIS